VINSTILDRMSFPDGTALPGGGSWTAVPTFWDCYRTGALYFRVSVAGGDGTLSRLDDVGVSGPGAEDPGDWSPADRTRAWRDLDEGIRVRLGLPGGRAGSVASGT
jgi:hypothetical protein